MEMLPLPELGAVPWDGDDLKKVLSAIFDELGCAKPALIVQRWKHSSCSGWSVNLHRDYLETTEETIVAKKASVVAKAASVSSDVL
jgi:hypothetical protein